MADLVFPQPEKVEAFKAMSWPQLVAYCEGVLKHGLREPDQYRIEKDELWIPK